MKEKDHFESRLRTGKNLPFIVEAIRNGYILRFGDIVGIPILVPKSSYVEQECSLFDWDVYIKTFDFDSVPVTGEYGNKAVMISRFREYYEIDGIDIIRK